MVLGVYEKVAAMLDLRELGTALKVRRVSLHYASATALAEHLGCNLNVITRIEKGETPRPRAGTLRLLETALRLQPDTLWRSFAHGEELRFAEHPGLSPDRALPDPARFLDAVPGTAALLQGGGVNEERRQRLSELIEKVYAAGFAAGSLSKEMESLTAEQAGSEPVRPRGRG
ncbi:hypothetical protein Lfu02_35670 [Longispora fulva]|uniref:Transcriptional regulator with XRE-family HTH domain n=1 Tax=Longispora fulva TaxID=619741 RepID=A0A8J7H041_9ACTN|nr:helix-turn-helix transcriptional regulator [Longispora fulva]MBG6141650.1 transcriptional regulator with XRE-family HTH domain [Longispora fulva]GIG59195.1 hypothetical protein Lfu02_35670 [Longispora fulva]